MDPPKPWRFGAAIPESWKSEWQMPSSPRTRRDSCSGWRETTVSTFSALGARDWARSATTGSSACRSRRHWKTSWPVCGGVHARADFDWSSPIACRLSFRSFRLAKSSRTRFRYLKTLRHSGLLREGPQERRSPFPCPWLRGCLQPTTRCSCGGRTLRGPESQSATWVFLDLGGGNCDRGRRGRRGRCRVLQNGISTAYGAQGGESRGRTRNDHRDCGPQRSGEDHIVLSNDGPATPGPRKVPGWRVATCGLPAPPWRWLSAGTQRVSPRLDGPVSAGPGCRPVGFGGSHGGLRDGDQQDRVRCRNPVEAGRQVLERGPAHGGPCVRAGGRSGARGA